MHLSQKQCVIYYGEKLDGTGYEELKTETHQGVTNADVTATTLEIAGFTYQPSHSENVTSGTIKADGSLALKLYYSRNSYTVSLDFNGESMKQALWNWDGKKMEIVGFDVENESFTLKYGQPINEQLFEDFTFMVKTGEQVYDESVDGWADEEIEVSYKDAFAGYIFDKWSGLCDTMPADDLILTAQWIPMEITVKLLPRVNNFNGQMVDGEPIVFSASYGDVIDLIPYSFTADGYFMVGWNYHAHLTAGTEIVKGLVLVNGYYSYEHGYSVSNGNESYGIPAGEVHIVASWGDEYYKRTITFDANGGTGIMADQLVAADNRWVAISRNRFVRDGYRFVGWSTEPDGEVQYAEGDMPVWCGDVRLYALWEPIG